MKILNCPHEQFIRVWQTSNSVREVADKLDMERNLAGNRACSLRKRGIPLKHFPKENGPKYDYASLARLAEEYCNGTKHVKPAFYIYKEAK